MGLIFSGLSASWSAVSTACCAMSCCCSFTSCLTAGAYGEKMARIVYLVYFLIAAALALIMKTYGNNAVLNLGSFQFGCVNGTTSTPYSSINSLACAGNQVVYRIGFGLALFYLLCSLFAFAGKSIHQGLWGIKSLFYVAAIVGSFFINNNVFLTYSDVARWLSFIFLLMQVVAIIDFAYSWHESWLHKSLEADEVGTEPGLCSNKWRFLYVVTSFTLLLTSIIGTCYLYAVFVCPTSQLFISLTIAGIFIIAGLSFSALTRGLLGGSIICLYMAYMCWSALSSFPDLACNPTLDSEHNVTGVFGFLIALFSLSYSAFSLAQNSEQITGSHGDALLEVEDPPLIGGGGAKEEDDDTTGIKLKQKSKTETQNHGEKEEEEEINSTLTSRLYFLAVMCIGSCYMSMLLTNWAGDAGVTSASDPSNVGVGLISMWIKIVSQWLTFAAYIWTIAAPVICTSRSFD